MTTLHGWMGGMSRTVYAPTGLILALKDNRALEAGWSSYSTFNSKFLKGTSAEIAGTTGARSASTITVSTGGAHIASQNVFLAQRGANGGSALKSPSFDPSYIGGHAVHTFTPNARPDSTTLRLVKANANTNFHSGALMFATAANSYQTQFNTLNGDRCIEASTVNGTTTGTISIPDSTYTTFTHQHMRATSETTSGILNANQDISSDGPSHNHTAGSYTSSISLNRVAVRCFEIIESQRILGLIGMWDGIGCPPRWTIVAEFDGKYLYLSSTGDGTSTGNNTLTIDGSTSLVTHAHTTSNPYGSNSVGNNCGHIDAVAHGHAYSGVLAYEPERVNIKFIRYTG